MARINSDLGTVLKSVVSRLIDEGLFPAECCYLTIDGDDEDNIAPSAGEFVCTVSPLAGNFAEQYLDGGGQLQATDFFDFVVSVYSIVQTDQYDRETIFLSDPAIGLLAKLKDVLRVMTVHDLVDTEETPNNILRDPILPQGYRFRRLGRGLGLFKLTCRAAFDWELSQ